VPAGPERKEVRPVAIDPVCGMDVPDAKAAGKSEHGGKTYYFCSVECQEEFEDDPESYLDDLESEGPAERKTA
jgi:Cu+-exporting ATPase